jgi:RNA polymerase sigma factor (sigma-70 family)
MRNPMGPFHAGHIAPTASRGPQDKHFESVYNKYYRKIYSICLRYSSKTDDAKDLAHDVFVRYFQNFDKFRGESSPSTWMHRVAINLGIQRWRKERIRFLDDQELESIPVETVDNESLMLDRIALAKILDRCPERTRKILSLFHVERMTQVEIGKLLGISRATVIRHLIHLKGIRQRLMKRESVPGTLIAP